jgi:outer membrane protein assembly factor BamB
VDGDIVYATPGGKEYNIIALDRHSGDLVWLCKGEGELSAYCTPLLFEHRGRKLLVTHSEAHLLGIDAISGELLWSVDVPTEYSVHFCTPLYENGEIFFPTGNETGGGKLRLSEDGSSVSVLWNNQVCDYRVSAIYVNGFIYESFSNYDRLTWRCMDWDSGEEKFISSELAPGRSVFADGMLYLYTYKGELALVKPDPAAFKVVSQTKVKSGSGLQLAQPMIHDGILYLRHGKSMIAYSIGNQ